mmetsp:Transcript_15784/g.23776  ORF Transcript_15784/g.23776 Transcript_15784/m.23776 type:complete len:119 (-) Transcript_15784:752-1108(-)
MTTRRNGCAMGAAGAAMVALGLVSVLNGDQSLSSSRISLRSRQISPFLSNNRRCMTAKSAVCDCDSGTATISTSGSPVQVTASTLRGLTLKDVNDNIVDLGEQMGSGKSVVVFLRHLG